MGLNPSTSHGFNGGTITEPVVIATTDGNVIPLKIIASWNAQNQDFFQVVNSDTNPDTRMFAVDVSGNVIAFQHTSESTVNLKSDGGQIGGDLPGVVGRGAIGNRTLGFFDQTAAAQPTGVAVTAAAIHAALVTLGLITA